MTGYVLRRFLRSAAVLLGVSFLVFAIMQLVPGDPVRLALGTRLDPDRRAACHLHGVIDVNA